MKLLFTVPQPKVKAKPRFTFTHKLIPVVVVPGHLSAASVKVCLRADRFAGLRLEQRVWRLGLKWEVQGGKNGSIYNFTIVLLPRSMQLRRARRRESRMARSGTEHPLRLATVRCGSACLWTAQLSNYGEGLCKWSRTWYQGCPDQDCCFVSDTNESHLRISICY